MVNNNNRGDVKIEAVNGNFILNEFIFTEGTSIKLEATEKPGYKFYHWIIGDDRAEIFKNNPLSLNSLTEDTKVQAVYAIVVNNFTDTNVAENTLGTFRYALTNSLDNEIIYFMGEPGLNTIELTRS